MSRLLSILALCLIVLGLMLLPGCSGSDHGGPASMETAAKPPPTPTYTFTQLTGPGGEIVILGRNLTDEGAAMGGDIPGACLWLPPASPATGRWLPSILTGYSVAWDSNSSCTMIVGKSGGVAARWGVDGSSNWTVTALPPDPALSIQEAHLCNDNGIIVGLGGRTDRVPCGPIVWKTPESVPIALPTPTGNCLGCSINAANIIGGAANFATGSDVAALWFPDASDPSGWRPQLLQLPAGCDRSWGAFVSNTYVAATCWGSSVTQRVYRWSINDLTHPTDLGYPPTSVGGCSVQGVNDSGWIIVKGEHKLTSKTNCYAPFIWKNGVWTDLQVTSGGSPYMGGPYSINARGEVVGGEYGGCGAWIVRPN